MSSFESEESLSFHMLAFSNDDKNSCHERLCTQLSLKISFTLAFFNPFQPTPTSWSIDKIDNQMFPISIEILKIKYVVFDSIVLEKTEKNKLASSLFPGRVTLLTGVL